MGQGRRGVPVSNERKSTNGDGVALRLVASGGDESVSELCGEAQESDLVQGQRHTVSAS